jgi:hypothetical protein
VDGAPDAGSHAPKVEPSGEAVIEAIGLDNPCL